MKCIVFGGGGFIGSAIVDRLLEEGHYVRIFDRPQIKPFRDFSCDEQVEWISGDILHSRDVSDALENMDAAIHLVSTTLPKSSNEDPIYDVQTNIVGTLQILNAMRLKKVGRLVFISSGGTVYGIPKYLPIDEHHPTEPLVSYGVTKLAIEKYLQIYQRLHGIRTIVLRVTNPYGKRQRIETAQGAVGVFLHRALHGKQIEIWGDGSVQRDYIYIDDVADAFAKALEYSGQESVFNISSGVGTNLNELIEAIQKAVGTTLKRCYLAGRPFDVPVSILSSDLAQRELNWKPKVGMSEGIRITMEWMKEKI